MRPAGQYNQPLIIEQAAESQSAARATVIDWDNATLIAETWGEILPGTSREVALVRQVTPSITTVIRARGCYVAVTDKMRVRHKYDGRTWDITAVRTNDGNAPQYSEELLLDCVEGMRAGS